MEGLVFLMFTLAATGLAVGIALLLNCAVFFSPWSDTRALMVMAMVWVVRVRVQME
jgi:hypothetical protein